MYTANTMASAIETMGMTLPGSSSNPANSQAKYARVSRCWRRHQEPAEGGHPPSDILTRQAFENAMVVVNITGGSTNAVLHLIAIADSVGIKLTIDDFQAYLTAFLSWLTSSPPASTSWLTCTPSVAPPLSSSSSSRKASSTALK